MECDFQIHVNSMYDILSVRGKGTGSTIATPNNRDQNVYMYSINYLLRSELYERSLVNSNEVKLREQELILPSD